MKDPRNAQHPETCSLAKNNRNHTGSLDPILTISDRRTQDDFDFVIRSLAQVLFPTNLHFHPDNVTVLMSSPVDTHLLR